MTDLRAAAQQALEALEMAEFDPHSSDAVHKAITALRAALAEPVQDGFDQLITEMEADPEGAQALEDGRRWVKDQFYAGEKPVQEPQCNPHPKAPHGFLRNASHNEDRYICECEGWEPYEAGYQAGMEAALAEPVQKPVAWMVYTLDGKSVCVTDNPADFNEQHKALPLYTRGNT